MLARFTIIFSVFLGLLVAILPNILWLIGWVIGKCCHYSLSYAPFGWTSLGLVLFVWTLVAYSYLVGRWQMETNKVTANSPMLPASFNGYRVVHISDFHLSTFDGKPEKVQRLVDAVNAEQPDLICFTGDLVTLGTNEAAPFTDILKQLHAKDGVMSVLGNHDFLLYNRSFRQARENYEEDKLTDPMALRLANSEAREAEVECLAAYQRDTLGWILLRNEHHVIHRGTDSLTIIGVDNTQGGEQGFSTINNGDLGKAMENTDGYRILLTHDPSHWEAEVLHKTDIPLTLSGHTHSAQVRLFGWNPASWMFHQSWGKYIVDDQTIYVNAGLGCTMPIRLNCPSEITVITLQQ